MEVHAHTHIPRKKWTHYLWEFLMLFLAVFCGFLAENQREHMVEHQREKKYAQTLLEDLINDTLGLKVNIPFWEKMVTHIDTVRSEIEKESSARNLLALYRCAALLVSNQNFTYHDRTIGQLKNAGNFRLLPKAIADSLIEYDASIISTMKDMEERYNITYFQNREVLQQQLFNTKFYEYRYEPEKLTAAAKLEPGIIEIKKGKEEILFQYYNCLFSLRQFTSARIRNLKKMLQRSTNLIEMIKKEYHLQ
jgi:hypothetical protein